MASEVFLTFAQGLVVGPRSTKAFCFVCGSCTGNISIGSRELTHSLCPSLTLMFG